MRAKAPSYLHELVYYGLEVLDRAEHEWVYAHVGLGNSRVSDANGIPRSFECLTGAFHFVSHSCLKDS
jgi:hypothetical protein